jgi:hypothetical protein
VQVNFFHTLNNPSRSGTKWPDFLTRGERARALIIKNCQFVTGIFWKNDTFIFTVEETARKDIKKPVTRYIV